MTERTLGPITFDAWEGKFQPELPVVEMYARPGTPKTGVSVGAKHGAETTVNTALYGELADCTAHRAACAALVGEVVSATDAHGTTMDATAVKSVTISLVPALGLGTKTHVVLCSWTLIPENAL